MRLYFNGCSFTYGTELVNPKDFAWPALVAKSMGADFVNDAVSGGTNDRIMYKTILNLHDFDFFFIAWTSYARFTEYNPIDNYEINFNPALSIDSSLHHSDDLRKNQKHISYGKIYYADWFNELYEFKKWLQQILLLQSLFKVNKKNCLMINTVDNNLNRWLQPKETFINSIKGLLPFFDHLNDSQIFTEYEQIQQLVSQIDQSMFIKWNEITLIEIGYPYPKGPGQHFLEEGHQAVANFMLEYYNNICSK